MAKTGEQTTTQETTNRPSPEQQRLLDQMMPIFEQYLNNPPTLPDFSQVAPFNSTQQQGMNLLLGAIAPQQQLAGAASGAHQFLLQDALSPESNKYLRETMDAAARPITQNLTENILPSIRGEAQVSGQLGGSRQGIAEGLAAGRTSQAVGDQAASIATQGYNSGLSAMVSALGMTPQMMQSMAIPGQTALGVGNMQYGNEQARLTEQYQRAMYEQLAPLLMAERMAAIQGGFPGGSSMTTQTTPGPEQNWLGTGIGAATLLASLFSGGAAGGAGGLGALLGGGGSSQIPPQILQMIMGGQGGLF